MTATKKQFDDYANRWAEAIPIHRSVASAIEAAVPPAELELAERIRRQRHFLAETRFECAGILRALAGR